MKFFKKGKKGTQLTPAEFLKQRQLDTVKALLEMSEDFGRIALLAFAEEKQITESVLYYLENRRFEGSTSLVSSAELGRQIYENFIRPDAKLELNIPQTARDNIRSGAEEAGHVATAQLAMVFQLATVEVLKMLDEYYDEFAASNYAIKLQTDVLEHEASVEQGNAKAKRGDWWTREPSPFETEIKDKHLNAGALNLSGEMSIEEKKKKKKKAAKNATSPRANGTFGISDVV
eukprot:TRINITY_DN808_c0_g1_i2.p1 TRINITY_DN808_c0_g1~~TRINITY_DN808_c0_g1_i2.p1  ORF type:complete len:268 (+),score=103.64 TRINITY_DN808_c0_g1_i2:111-806(+)